MPFSLLRSRHRPSGEGAARSPPGSDRGHDFSDAKHEYVENKGGNDSAVSYQDAGGAPVEVDSPLGYSVGSVTIVFLNLSKMIGTGIFSTRKCNVFPSIGLVADRDVKASSVYSGTGSVGLNMIYWFLGFLMSAAGFSVYLEYAACFPNRSGSEAVSLEQAYPRPR